MTSLDGFPTAARVLSDPPRIVLALDAEVYPRDALYAASSSFLARAFVHLDQDDALVPPGWVVTLTPRDPDASLRALGGEFLNELLVASSRNSIASRNRPLLEAVTRRAVAGAMGPPGLDDLESFDFDDDAFDDPLGIANSWEQRHASAGSADEGKREGGPE